MLRHTLIGTALLSVLFVTGGAGVDRAVQTYRSAMQAPAVAVGVIRQGEAAYVETYGDGIDEDTAFYIGSMSKSVTAAAVMQLVESGQIELDTPVQQLVPTLDLPTVTVRMLLLHTSGLSELAYAPIELRRSTADDALQAAAATINSRDLRAQSGGSFQYSNGNYMLLGLIIEEVSGLPYEEYIQTYIIEPLGMTSAQAGPSQRMTTGYRYIFGVPRPVEHPIDRAAVPYGYISASITDMTRYLYMMLNGGTLDEERVLSEASVQTLLTHSDVSRYGMGWYQTDDWAEQTIHFHPGGTPGFTAYMFLMLASDDALVLLTNTAGTLSPTDPAPYIDQIMEAAWETPTTYQVPALTLIVIAMLAVVYIGWAAWVVLSIRALNRQYKQGVPQGWGMFTRVLIPSLGDAVLILVPVLLLPCAFGSTFRLTWMVGRLFLVYRSPT